MLLFLSLKMAAVMAFQKLATIKMLISRSHPRARRAQPAVAARPPASALARRAGGGDSEPGQDPAVAGSRRQGCCRGSLGPARVATSLPSADSAGGLQPGRERAPGARFSQQFRYFVQLPIFTQASLPPLNETPLLRDVQPLHLIKEIALQC